MIKINGKKAYTRKEVSEILGISYGAMENLEHKFKPVKADGRSYYIAEDLQEYLHSVKRENEIRAEVMGK
ncbi:MAG: hypothetical protein HUJ54_14000 [Erysipelotrichaceae bacterium]|nr:hypothetical protein [Erysipelotrichaceae bacterium]